MMRIGGEAEFSNAFERCDGDLKRWNSFGLVIEWLFLRDIDQKHENHGTADSFTKWYVD